MMSRMRRSCRTAYARGLFAAALSCSALLGVPAAIEAAEPRGASPAIVESVSVQQNRFIPKDTLLYYVSTKAGERFDENRLRADFRRLWETGLVDDILLDVRDGRRGKIVTFVVRERRRILLVDYRGSKAITKSSIEDKLKEKEARIQLDSLFDLAKVRRVESILRDMLMEEGRPFGTVKHETKPVGGAGLQLSFVIDDGPKTSVGQVAFLGNRLYSDGTLRHRMRKVRTGGFFSLTWLLGSKYTEERWRADHTRIEDFYRARGYATATIGEPTVSYYDSVCGLFKRHPCKRVRLEIPVSEGERYRVGQLKIEGMTVLREDAVRRLVKLKTGDVYNGARIKKAYDKMRDWYGTQGYFNWTPQTDTQPDREKRIVDVTLKMQEDKRYYVGKVNIVGNDSTRDKVVRREIYIDEGGVFNTEALKMSVKRINQLGYFKPIDGFPELGASALGEDRVDVTIKVKEQNRNQFTIGGGVSGYDGTFINSSFSTSNFLGMGETLEVAAQTGARSKNYQFSVSEPYFLDRPITLGAEVYHRRNLILMGFDSANKALGYFDQRTGGTVTGGFAVGRWTRLFSSYTYEVVDIRKASRTELSGYDRDRLDSKYAYAQYGYLYDDYGRRYESRLTPSLVRNTVDNPYTPRSGSRISATLGLAGGPLAGTLNYVRPSLELVKYLPHTRKTALGVRLLGNWVFPYGSTAHLRPLQAGETRRRDGLPFYHRFAVGGENQVRGYEFYSIPALVTSDNRAVYGDSAYVLNVEYYVDVFGPVRLLAFYDAGAAFLKSQRLTFQRFRVSTGLELRVIVPVINAPVRLIYAFNPNRSRAQIEQWGIKRYELKFSVGSTF